MSWYQQPFDHRAQARYDNNETSQGRNDTKHSRFLPAFADSKLPRVQFVDQSRARMSLLEKIEFLRQRREWEAVPKERLILHSELTN